MASNVQPKPAREHKLGRSLTYAKIGLRNVLGAFKFLIVKACPLR